MLAGQPTTIAVSDETAVDTDLALKDVMSLLYAEVIGNVASSSDTARLRLRTLSASECHGAGARAERLTVGRPARLRVSLGKVRLTWTPCAPRQMGVVGRQERLPRISRDPVCGACLSRARCAKQSRACALEAHCGVEGVERQDCDEVQ